MTHAIDCEVVSLFTNQDKIFPDMSTHKHTGTHKWPFLSRISELVSGETINT